MVASVPVVRQGGQFGFGVFLDNYHDFVGLAFLKTFPAGYPLLQ